MADVLSYLAYVVNHFKEFVVLSVIVTLLLMLYFRYVDKRYVRHRYATNLYGMFLRIDLLSKYQVIFFYLFFLYVTSLVIRFRPLSYLHIIAYIILALCSIVIAFRQVRLVLLNVANGIITFVILQVLNILLNYLLNVYFNQYYAIIYVFIGIALMMYCVFILVYQISFIVTKRRVR